MKKTFMKFLPIAAAVLLATSCSKDDNSAVVDNIATPDPVQEVVKPVAKTITITGKVNQTFSKVVSSEEEGKTVLNFDGTEVFVVKDKNKAECGSLVIQKDKSTYVANIDADKIDNSPFFATLGNYPDEDLAKGYQTLDEALANAYYEILPFEVTKDADDKYTIDDPVTAAIQCAFIKALSSKDITLGHVAAGNYYIIPFGLKFNGDKESVAGKIYKVGGKDALSGKFFVGDGKTVTFSKSNLMYRPGFGYFFADKQWDYVGLDECNYYETGGRRDLFCWGTWLEGGEPMESSKDNSVYGWDDTKKSAIGSEWSTLSNQHWAILLEGRGDNSYAKAKVAGTKGLILLPDDWETTTYELKNYNTTNAAFIDNTIDATDWPTLEDAGAVFLPSGGQRYGSSVNDGSVFYYGENGYYWSSTCVDVAHVYTQCFSSSAVELTKLDAYNGFSVRLVSGL